LLEEKIACSTNEIERNSCTDASKKKNLQSHFIIPGGGGLHNLSKTATIRDNLQASKPLWLAY